MKGLELCEKYFNEVGRPALERECAQYMDRMAFGLVGDGSDCYGYDDELSHDHDWGPGFCIWLTKEDFKAAGREIQAVFDNLPHEYQGYTRITSDWGEGRVGVMEIGAFYRRFYSKESAPETYREWLVTPDNAFAAATNGKVFHDPLGEFSKVRTALKSHYPEDVRLKKLAARCMSAGQAGQYNFPRCVKRDQKYAARHSEIKFCQDALFMVFLINKQYAPFYKWVHHAVQELPLLGKYMYDQIGAVLKEADESKKTAVIENICQALIYELKILGISDSESDYLLDHGPEIQKRIIDPEIRGLSVWIG
jgi:hypothetical protein